MTIQKIAKITDTMLGYEGHGILTAYLTVEYGGGTCQNIGGYGLDGPIRDDAGNFLNREGSAYGMEHVARIMKACGVESWEKVKGRTIFVIVEDDSWNAKVLGIENLPTEPGKRFLWDDIKSMVDA